MSVNKLLSGAQSFSEYQFSFWRILFGLYATYFALSVLPYVTELFSSDGIYPSVPETGPFPNILYWYDPAWFVLLLGVLSVVSALAIVVGYHRQLFALLAWYIHACWFGRNMLIDDPSLAYVGLLFLLLAIIPSGEHLSIDRSRHRRRGEDIRWELPLLSYWTALIALGVGYTVSGYDKLKAVGWQTGDAMYHMTHSGLVYDNLFVTFLHNLPVEAFYILSWFSLFGMLFALPGLLWRSSRFLTWIILTAMFMVTSLAFDLTQVTLGMLFFHLFLFDRTWVPAKKTDHQIIWYYDTNCNLCQAYKSFIEHEDRNQVTSFRSIYEIKTDLDSMVLQVNDHQYTYSDSALQHWHYLGGVWRLLAWAGILIPKLLRDPVYRFIARNRYRWFGTCGCD